MQRKHKYTREITLKRTKIVCFSGENVRLVVGRPGFDSVFESNQNNLKVGIHSFSV